MNSFPEDLWSIILARLPLNNITTCKLVCKQWKSIVESPYFRDLFTSLPQNTQTSLWSLLFMNDITDAKAHYGCEPSLGSHILSFLTNKLENERDQYIICSYNHVGLILICDVPKRYKRRHYYVANSFSQECIELPYHHHDMNYPLGIVTQTENGVVLSYKVVLLDFGFCGSKTELSFLIYSSEKGLWSLKTFYLPFSLPYEYFYRSVSLNGSLYWVNRNSDNEDVIVSQDFYAIGTDSNRCRVALFPDLDKHPKFRRACTISQGFFMYTK